MVIIVNGASQRSKLLQHFFLTILSIANTSHAIISQDDSCDHLKWRTCEHDTDCEWDQWKHRPYDTVNDPPSIPALWESADTYVNFKSYTCAIPEIEWNMTNCPTPRCIPDLISGYACMTNVDCYNGQICSEDKVCVACSENVEEAKYFSDGACHQPETEGLHGSPAFNEGQSGCAGDHCHHSCAYDTKCVRVLDDTTELDLTATHNQLAGVLSLADITVRDALTRPSACGANDAGLAGSGMRCARTIHRAITSLERTPDSIRDRNLDVVELSVMKTHENFTTLSDDDVANDRALVIAGMFGEGRGYSVGYAIPNNGDGTGVRSEAGSTLGTGVFARKFSSISILFICEIHLFRDMIH